MTRSAPPSVERAIDGAGSSSPASTVTPIRLDGIPIPPSTNALYRNVQGRGRVKTQRYLTWQRAAGNAILAQETTPIHGDVEVSIFVPRDNRRDIDNYCKGLLDLIVAHKLIDDDRFITVLHVMKLDRANDKKTCTVKVRPAC